MFDLFDTKTLIVTLSFVGMLSVIMAISLPFLSNGYLELNTIFYVMLVVLVITASSNAVNLTDGLDGLAIGLLAISLLSFAGIAYASGRTDFSDYLNIIYISYNYKILCLKRRIY